MSQNGNGDDADRLRYEEGVTVTRPLLPRELAVPAQYEDGVTWPLLPRELAVPAQYEPAEPRFYKSTRPEERGERVRGEDASWPEERGERVRGDDAGGPQARPRLLDRLAANQPSGDGDDNDQSDNSPPPASRENPQSDSNSDGSNSSSSNNSNSNSNSSSGGHGGSVFVDTDKLSQAIPGLDGIMRQMYAIGNGTANALAGFRLDRGDSYGEAWTRTADPISAQILEGLADAGSVFGDTAEGAHLMVHNYNITEENAVNSAGDLLAREE